MQQLSTDVVWVLDLRDHGYVPFPSATDIGYLTSCALMLGGGVLAAGLRVLFTSKVAA